MRRDQQIFLVVEDKGRCSPCWLYDKLGNRGNRYGKDAVSVGFLSRQVD